MVGRLFQIGSRTGKKTREPKINFGEIRVVFDNHRNYEVYYKNLVQVMKSILYTDVEVEHDWERKQVKFIPKNGKPIISKEREQVEVIVKKWRDKLRHNMICKFHVYTVVDWEEGIIHIELK